MNPKEVGEHFDYLIDTRARFLDTFRKLGWDEFEKDRGATWGSMLAIFLHLLDNEEGWLQFAARGRSMLNAPDRKVADYASFEQLAADNAKVVAQTRAFVQSLTETELASEVEFHMPHETMHRTREKIVMHAFVDELAHLGEFVCLLWQLDVEPPFIDWLDYRVG